MNPKGPNQGKDSAVASAPAEKQSEQTPQRISAKMKTRIVQRLMRGESLEILAREHGTTAAKISKWRDEFLNAGEEAMKSRNGDAKDQEIARLQKKLGETTMDYELLLDKVRHLENNSPLGRGRSKK